MEPGRGALAVLSTFRTVAETGSTNADMLGLASAGASDGMWLRAETQSSGRGRLGRNWVSPPGNLYASVLLRLRPTDLPAPTLALVTAVALEEAVRLRFREANRDTPGRHIDPELSLKWPNDLLIDGAKLSGILLEGADAAVVIGIGVNLAHHPDLPDRSTTSLAAHGIAVEPDAFLASLAETLDGWIDRWRGEGLAPVLDRWMDRAHSIGTPLTARLPGGTAIEGRFDGLDAHGALMLRLADGERRVIHAADIFPT